MAIGDYLSNMFLGSAYNQGNQPEEAKKGLQELWKIYQQAYNVKPIWNGKQWVMPSGAVQRFQMLLPLIQAQIQGAYQGQGKGTSGKTDYGILGGALGKLGGGLWEAGGKKLGGWDKVLGKVGDSIKDLWNTGMDSLNYSTDYDFDPQEAADWDTAFTPGALDTSGWETADLPTGMDWDIPADSYVDDSWLDAINYDTDWADVGYW